MATDWGSVADWLSAIGSVGAVVAALILAGAENARARRAENKLAREADERIVRVFMLLEISAAACRSFVEQVKPDAYHAPLREWREAMDRTKRLATELKAMGPYPFEVVAALAEAIDTARVEKELGMLGEAYMKQVARRKEAMFSQLAERGVFRAPVARVQPILKGKT